MTTVEETHEKLDVAGDELIDVMRQQIESLKEAGFRLQQERDEARELRERAVSERDEALENVELRTNERDQARQMVGARTSDVHRMEAERDSIAQTLDRVRATCADLVTQVEQEKQRVADLIREKSDADLRLENLWEALGNEADRRDWCSEYDEFAEHHGGPRRLVEIDWSAIIEVKIDMSETIDVSLDSVEFPTGMWVPMRFTVSGTREGRRNACVCESYEAQERAQEDLSNESVPWDDMRVVSQTCDAH